MQNQLLREGMEELQRYHKAIDGNKQYVEAKLKEDPEYFSKLAEGQSPKYLLIGCSDSRAPPNELTQTDPGDIFIHRNIANLVIPTDLNINCVIQYAVEHLKVHNIIIMGHTKCGGIKAAFAQESVGGLLDLWLNQIKAVYDKHQSVVDSFEQESDKLNCLCYMNVREQVMNVWKNPIVQKSWEEGHPVMVHGWLFRVETGIIEELSLDNSVPDEMSKVFRLQFKKKQEEQEKQLTPPYKRRFYRMQSQLELQYHDNQMIEQLNLDENKQSDVVQEEIGK